MPTPFLYLLEAVADCDGGRLVECALFRMERKRSSSGCLGFDLEASLSLNMDSSRILELSLFDLG